MALIQNAAQVRRESSHGRMSGLLQNVQGTENCWSLMNLLRPWLNDVWPL